MELLKTETKAESLVEKSIPEIFYKNERPLIGKIKITKAEYKPISLDFLSQSRIWKGIKVPRFAVHKLVGNEFKDLDLTIRLEICETYDDKQYLEMTISPDKNSSCNFILLLIEKTIKPNSEETRITGKKRKLTEFEKNFFDTYKKLPGITEIVYNTVLGFRLVNRFIGIIPLEAQRQIEKARPFFDEINLIVEVENWSVKSVPIKDPLVIGLFEDEAFSITKFDTTPLENYVNSEF